MGRLLLILLIAGAAYAALQLAIVVIVLAGLIFRTKETVGLLAILAAFALLEAYPLATIGGVAAVVLFAVARVARRGTTAEGRERPRLRHATEAPEQE